MKEKDILNDLIQEVEQLLTKLEDYASPYSIGIFCPYMEKIRQIIYKAKHKEFIYSETNTGIKHLDIFKAICDAKLSTEFIRENFKVVESKFLWNREYYFTEAGHKAIISHLP